MPKAKSVEELKKIYDKKYGAKAKQKAEEDYWEDALVDEVHEVPGKMKMVKEPDQVFKAKIPKGMSMEEALPEIEKEVEEKVGSKIRRIK